MNRLNAIPFIWLLLPLVAAIIVVYYCFPAVLLPAQADYVGFQATYLLRLQSVPTIGEKWVKAEGQMIGEVDSVGSARSISGRSMVYVAIDSAAMQLRQGDVLLCRATPYCPTADCLQKFDYAHYLRLQGITTVSYLHQNEWQVVYHQQLRGIRAVAERCRSRIVGIFARSGVVGKQLAVLSALTVGERSGLDPDIKQQYSTAGAMHVLAVSGLHVGIIAAVLMQLLTFFGLFPLLYSNRRRQVISTLLLIMAVWAYAFLTGLSPSVVRSSLMISLLTIGQTLRRQVNTYNIIFASAFIVLLVSPLSLFSVSFQLSYAAVLSIVYFQPKISAIYRPFTYVGRYLWGLVTVSVAAQIGTLPLSLWYFGQVSNYFALTNLFVIVFAQMIVCFAILLLLVFYIPFVGHAVGWAVNMLVWLMNTAVGWVESLPFSSSHLTCSPLMLTCLLLIVMTLAVWSEWRKWWQLSLVAVSAVLFVVSVWLNLTRFNRVERMIVATERTADIIVVQQGRSFTVLTDSLPLARQRTNNLMRQYMATDSQYVDLQQESAYSFCWHDTTFLWVGNNAFEDKRLSKPISCNALLLSAYIAPWQDEVWKYLQADSVVLMPSLRQWQRAKMSD